MFWRLLGPVLAPLYIWDLILSFRFIPFIFPSLVFVVSKGVLLCSCSHLISSSRYSVVTLVASRAAALYWLSCCAGYQLAGGFSFDHVGFYSNVCRLLPLGVLVFLWQFPRLPVSIRGLCCIYLVNNLQE